jgi:hypothetical protein
MTKLDPQAVNWRLWCLRVTARLKAKEFGGLVKKGKR